MFTILFDILTRVFILTEHSWNTSAKQVELHSSMCRNFHVGAPSAWVIDAFVWSRWMGWCFFGGGRGSHSSYGSPMPFCGGGGGMFAPWAEFCMHCIHKSTNEHKKSPAGYGPRKVPLVQRSVSHSDQPDALEKPHKQQVKAALLPHLFLPSATGLQGHTNFGYWSSIQPLWLIAIDRPHIAFKAIYAGGQSGIA